jgi:predicted kinase
VDSVYDTVLRRAAEPLAAGVSVILDGTWRDPGHRRRARETARRAQCPITELACTVGLAEAQARIAGRAAGDSDADPAVAAAMASETRAWSGAHPIDTGRPLPESVAEAQHVCRLAI